MEEWPRGTGSSTRAPHSIPEGSPDPVWVPTPHPGPCTLDSFLPAPAFRTVFNPAQALNSSQPDPPRTYKSSQTGSAH